MDPEEDQGGEEEVVEDEVGAEVGGEGDEVVGVGGEEVDVGGLEEDEEGPGVFMWMVS